MCNVSWLISELPKSLDRSWYISQSHNLSYSTPLFNSLPIYFLFINLHITFTIIWMYIIFTPKFITCRSFLFLNSILFHSLPRGLHPLWLTHTLSHTIRSSDNRYLNYKKYLHFNLTLNHATQTSSSTILGHFMQLKIKILMYFQESSAIPQSLHTENSLTISSPGRCEPHIMPTCVLNLKNHWNLDLVWQQTFKNIKIVVFFSLYSNWI